MAWGQMKILTIGKMFGAEPASGFPVSIATVARYHECGAAVIGEKDQGDLNTQVVGLVIRFAEPENSWFLAAGRFATTADERLAALVAGAVEGNFVRAN